MRAGNRLRLGAAVALELGPDTGEGCQRSIIAEGEPDYILFLVLRVGFWRDAACLTSQPSSAALAGPHGGGARRTNGASSGRLRGSATTCKLNASAVSG